MFITTLTITVYFIDRIFHIDIPYLTHVLIMIIFTVPFATLNFLFTKRVLTPLINKADVKTSISICCILFIILVINSFATYDLSWKQSFPIKYIIIRLFSFLGTIEVIVILKRLVEEQENRLILSEDCKRQEVLLAIQKEQFYSLSEKIEETLDKIEREILTDYSGEIKSSELGDKILSYLIDLDEIAYVRFASVYKKFDSLDSFVKEIEKIRNDKKK